MPNLKDLPSSVTVILDEESAIDYPVDGTFEKTFQVELICHNRKNYTKTWKLRQRVMQANLDLIKLVDGMEMPNNETQTEEEVDVDAFKQMLLMGGFDAEAAMEEFKNFAVAEGLIMITEDFKMDKNRWSTVDDYAKEKILFTYLANFIQPCVA